MNKEQKIKKLTWKYFWQQKVDEFIDNLSSIMALSITFSFCFLLAGGGLLNFDYPMGRIFICIGVGIILFWILVGIILLIINIKNWLSGNWKKAKRRAKEDLKNG